MTCADGVSASLSATCPRDEWSRAAASSWIVRRDAQCNPGCLRIALHLRRALHSTQCGPSSSDGRQLGDNLARLPSCPSLWASSRRDAASDPEPRRLGAVRAPLGRHPDTACHAQRSEPNLGGATRCKRDRMRAGPHPETLPKSARVCRRREARTGRSRVAQRRPDGCVRNWETLIRGLRQKGSKRQPLLTVSERDNRDSQKPPLPSVGATCARSRPAR